nr:immunoglobulin heavy chain junction region [Macaca mulatta]MOW19390.1 immunoglobulin heavy chain junction region [Macaca mulatta]MOW20295.1 immunoglobulin heavy chain junction region [Macaca mulatta]
CASYYYGSGYYTGGFDYW